MNNNFNADDKIMKYLDKLNYFFNGHKTLIVTEFDLTNKCNNRCPGCCGVNENRAELNKEQIDNIIKYLKDIDNKGVILSGGGEPLISPYFEYTIHELRKNGIKIGVNSNGLALDENKAKTIIENCEYFRISLDAATPEMYKETHGMNSESFKKVIENCKMFTSMKKKINSNISYGVGFLTNSKTAHEMEKFVLLCKEIGADFAQFRPFTGDMTDVTDEYLRLKQIYDDNDFSVKASLQKYREMSTNGSRNYSKCRGMFFSTVITADAKVYSCLHNRQNEDHLLGDLNKQSLEDIFRSPRIREVYEYIDCAKCPMLCRNDVFNRTLNVLDLDVNHIEFL